MTRSRSGCAIAVSRPIRSSLVKFSLIRLPPVRYNSHVEERAVNAGLGSRRPTVQPPAPARVPAGVAAQAAISKRAARKSRPGSFGMGVSVGDDAQRQRLVAVDGHVGRDPGLAGELD